MRVMRYGLTVIYTAIHHMGVSPRGLLATQAADASREDDYAPTITSQGGHGGKMETNEARA